MRRYDLEDISRLSSYERYDAMVERHDGDWIQHDDHLAEVRQTQRRMIAALYWRAGHMREVAAGYTAMGEAHASFILQDSAEAVMASARAMEAAL